MSIRGERFLTMPKNWLEAGRSREDVMAFLERRADGQELFAAVFAGFQAPLAGKVGQELVDGRAGRDL
jgi:hypothetical protein